LTPAFNTTLPKKINADKPHSRSKNGVASLAYGFGFTARRRSVAYAKFAHGNAANHRAERRQPAGIFW
jgi:hypothetical protein